MTDSTSDISVVLLTQSGIEDTARALRTIHNLAGQGVTDDDIALLLPALLQSLRSSPDPDRALSSLGRWFEAIGSRVSHLQLLRSHPFALDLFCLVAGSSQVFADLIVRQPEYFAVIADPGEPGGAKTSAQLYREIASLVEVCNSKELKRDALRRWKAREMLRIGVRDLAGLADMPTTASEFSNLADACVQIACDIAFADRPLAEPEEGRLPFAVIAMGKLGGQELNYSSDIDLIFVHGDSLSPEVALKDGRRTDTLSYLTRLAETVVSILASETAQGHVFRVDMRLRPEGRFGPLTRSLASFRAYYESWAESWERQSLLKARFIAGDRAVGTAFISLITAYVYRRTVSLAFLEDIRANKRRIESQTELKGETQTNIKTGYGGIRDIEFLVQKLQLEFGGVWPYLRTTNTLQALQRLQFHRFLTEGEAQPLSEDYQFLRTLEHRLQLLQGFQTQTLPTDPKERAHLARRMGFADPALFEQELAFRRDRVRSNLLHLFYGDDRPSALVEENLLWAEPVRLLDNIDSPEAQERLTQHLRSAGFHDPVTAIRILQLTLQGNEFGEMTPDTAGVFLKIAPYLLEQLAHSPDADAALAGIEALALAVPSRAQLYVAFDESPDLLRRVVQLGAASPPLMRRLAQHLEWMETIMNPEEATGILEAEPVPYVSFVLQEYRERTRNAPSRERKLDSIARVYQRELLRIGAQDSWAETELLTTMRRLTELAEATLQILLETTAEQIAASHPQPERAQRILSRVAIVGLGKLGGAELNYMSDWDVVFTYNDVPHNRSGPDDGDCSALVTGLVEQMLASSAELVTRGAKIEIDLRLRPWGRKGAVIQSTRSFVQYFRTAGETWERQAALKGRFVAGNPHVGQRLVRILQAVSFGRGLTAEEDSAVQAMKARIEAERLKPSERETDLKLGYGGLTDIEWLAQRLQLLNGKRRPALRVSNTLQALSALAAARLLDNAEADILSHAYLLLARVRNAIWLQTGKAWDVFPTDIHQQQRLAGMLGYLDHPSAPAAVRLQSEIRDTMREVRRIFIARFTYAGDRV